MHDLPARLRDATVQVLADACDARWGLSCFRLATFAWCGGIVGYLAVGCVLSLSDHPRVGVSGIPFLCVAAVLGAIVAVFAIHFVGLERRARCTDAPTVIPAIRGPLMIGLDLATMGIYMVGGPWMVTRAIQAIATGHDALGGPLVRCAFTGAVLLTCMLPLGGLLASCEWKRLHGPRFGGGRPVESATA